MRTKALLIQENPRPVTHAFRSAYGVCVPDNETLMSEVRPLVADLILAGASAHDLIAILSNDSAKTDTLAALAVGPMPVRRFARQLRGSRFSQRYGFHQTQISVFLCLSPSGHKRRACHRAEAGAVLRSGAPRTIRPVHQRLDLAQGGR